MSKKRTGPSLVGGSSLLCIFAVLCLVIFAILSLTTARAGARLSQQSARSVSDYYRADAEAEATLARLRAGEIPDGVTARGSVYSYTCPISDTLSLAVSVHLEGDDYTILRWQSVSTVEWTPDDDLNLWDGSPG